MRISTNQQANSIINQLNNVSGNLAKYQLQVSSGKKYESMSENPGATAQILSYNHVLSQLNREKTDVTEAKSLLNTAETSLSSMSTSMNRVNALVLQAINGTSDKDNMSQSAEEIKGLLDVLISVANSEDDGRYVFSGSSTSVKPFTTDKTTGEIIYNGTTENKKFRVTDTLEVEVFHDGSAMTDVFNNIQKIVDAMKTGDKDALSALQETNSKNIEIITNSMTNIGGQKNGVAAYDNVLSSKIVDFSERKSNVEEVNMSEAVSNLNKTSIAYQAALQSSVMVQKLSILNYM
ncbi:flagellar hook-associated protein 3 [Listeria monocytogenes]